MFIIDILGETRTWEYDWTDDPQEKISELSHKYENEEVLLTVQLYRKNKWVTYDKIYWSPPIK